MVYFNGLDSIIESIYLEDKLGSRVGECNVFVNPDNIKYLVGKVCIINSLSYPIESIESLIDNGNKVISRIWLGGLADVIFQPYIIRISLGIMYNGRNIKGKVDPEVILQDYCSFPDSVLYFPKIDPSCYDVQDSKGNLTSLGWASHQVGVRINENLAFQDLDIIKLGKLKL